MLYHVTVGDRTLTVELDASGVVVDGRRVDADLRHVPGTRLVSLLLDGASHRIVSRRSGPGRWDLVLRGHRLRAEVVDERTRVIREMTGTAAVDRGPRPLRAPMPGLVVKVEVEEGQQLEAGDGVVVMEAMKMENELRMDAPGTVRRIRVGEGEAVEKDQVLVEFEA